MSFILATKCTYSILTLLTSISAVLFKTFPDVLLAHDIRFQSCQRPKVWSTVVFVLIISRPTLRKQYITFVTQIRSKDYYGPPVLRIKLLIIKINLLDPSIVYSRFTFHADCSIDSLLKFTSTSNNQSTTPNKLYTAKKKICVFDHKSQVQCRIRRRRRNKMMVN